MIPRDTVRDVALTGLAGLLSAAGAALDAAFLMARATGLPQATRLSLLARAVDEVEQQLGADLTDAIAHHDDAPGVAPYRPDGG